MEAAETEDEREAEGRRRARRRPLCLGVEERLHPDRRQQQRGRQSLSQDCHPQVALRDVAQDARHDPPALERRAVGAQGLLGPRAARHVVEDGGSRRAPARASSASGAMGVAVRRAASPASYILELAERAKGRWEGGGVLHEHWSARRCGGDGGQARPVDPAGERVGSGRR